MGPVKYLATPHFRISYTCKGSIKRDTNNIRYVSQKNDFSHAGFPITVKEILDSYRKLLKIKDKHEVDRVLELTDMTEFKDRLISKLSGGQKRKRIARASSSAGSTSSSSRRTIYWFDRKKPRRAFTPCCARIKPSTPYYNYLRRGMQL